MEYSIRDLSEHNGSASFIPTYQQDNVHWWPTDRSIGPPWCYCSGRFSKTCSNSRLSASRKPRTASSRLTVDDRRHGQDNAVFVIDHRVDGLVLDDVQILLQVAFTLQQQNTTTVIRLCTNIPKLAVHCSTSKSSRATTKMEGSRAWSIVLDNYWSMSFTNKRLVMSLHANTCWNVQTHNLALPCNDPWADELWSPLSAHERQRRTDTKSTHCSTSWIAHKVHVWKSVVQTP